MKFIIILALLCLSLQASANNSNKHKVIWTLVHYPPLYNDIDGKQRGIHNRIADYIEKELKDDYEFSSVQSSVSRLIDLYASSTAEKTYCSPGGAVVPMPKIKHTDSLLFMVPSTGIAVRKKDTRFKNISHAKLATVIQKYKNIKIGIVENGSYHPEIKNIAKTNPKNFFQISTTKPEPSLKMLAKNRTDAFLIFPYTFTHTKALDNSDYLKSLRFVKIREAGEAIPAKIYCSDTKMGNVILKKIDRITQTKKFLKFKKEILKPYENYYKEINNQELSLTNKSEMKITFNK